MRKIIQRLVMVLVLALTLISPLETVSSAASETVRAAEAGGENHTDPVISDVKDSDCENTDTAMPDNENPGADEPDTVEPQPVLQGLIRDENGNLFYYKDGVKIKNTWKAVSGSKYYFGKSGKAYVGKRKVGKATYYFAVNGKRKTGWRTINGKKYYFSPKNGKMVTGKKTISHYLCYFSEKGVLLRKIDKNKKMVALTYDDGPSIYTPRILKTLKENNSVATFFVVGNRVPMYSDTVKKAYGMGCEIGNHTYEHKILTRADAAGIRNQVSRTNVAVKKITGTAPIVMRPPGGAVNNMVKSQTGMPMILWSIDTLDWRTRNAASTKTAVLDHVKDGDIVLMHDLYEATANASTTIIPTLVERGYQLVTVSELAECRGGMKDGCLYYSFRK
uniref:polysaccharide deacetylase family protein n=1 Tax=Agathobacter sp. TaxID=2021311 RepID=UPI004024BE58